MITFGGSPTVEAKIFLFYFSKSRLNITSIIPGVAVPPTFEKITIVIKMGTGLRPITSHNLIVTGVIRRMVVTLSKNADRTAVNKDRQVIKGHTLPLVIYEQKKINHLPLELVSPSATRSYLVSKNSQIVENTSF